MAAFQALGIIETVFFSGLLLMALYNTYFFLYKQRRYKIYFITVFYALAFMVLVFRVALSILLVIVAFDYETYREGLASTSHMLIIFLGLEILATYAKIVMGFFNVAAIIILTLQVKQKYVESIDTITWWLYFGVTIWCSSLVLSVIVFVSYLVHCLKHSDAEGSTDDCYQATEVGTTLNGVCFGILSMLYLLTVVPLFTALNNLQKGRMELT